MLQINGYSIKQVDYQSNRTVIYRGKTNSGSAVVFKTLNTNVPTVNEISRVRLEFNILNDLNIAGVPKAFALLMHGHLPVVVMEDMGVGLRQIEEGKLSVEQTLEVAIGVAKVLLPLHQKGIIHKDIKPENITVEANQELIGLVDFDIASRIGQDRQAQMAAGTIDGSLAYLSPEQTGRLRCPIDYRSDFYSLGVSLYELVTGSLPFEEQEQAKLVHAHLAHEAQPAHRVDSNIPEVFSDIIAKLMRKQADERYQSARGLLDDLTKIKSQWDEKQCVEHFTIGQSDISEQFNLPRKIYGRDKQLQVLTAGFEKVCTGEVSLTTIRGYSGIGKSSLMNEILPSLSAQHGHYVVGKFEQHHSHVPFFAILKALENLVEQLLTYSKDDIRSWQKKIRDGVGTQGQLIIDLIPNLEFVIGKQPAVPKLLGEDGANRLMNVLKGFVGAFANIEHPLVIFIDDLQWADASSLQFILGLMTSVNIQSLMFICAYRDNEVTGDHPFILTLEQIRTVRTLTDIKLRPLDAKSANAMIADMLRTDVGSTEPLSDIVYHKTRGNPFFMIQFLHNLHLRKLVYFDWQARCWRWDQVDIEQLDISDNVVDLMSAQIQLLGEMCRQLLALASCIGAQFDLLTLSKIGKLSVHQVTKALLPAIEKGMINPLNNHYRYFFDEDIQGVSAEKVYFQFVHDRIYEAAQRFLTDDSEAQAHVHWQIGQIMLDKCDEVSKEERIFDLCRHLNLGQRFVVDKEQKVALAALNLLAGKKAMNSAASRSALHFFTIGSELLGRYQWSAQYDLCFEMTRFRASSAYLCDDHTLANRLFNQCLKRASAPFDLGVTYDMMLSYYLVNTQYAKGFKMAQKALRLFGVELPTQRTACLRVLKAESDEIVNLMAGKSISALIDLPVNHDEEMELLQNLLMQTWTMGFNTKGNEAQIALVVVKMVRLTLLHGSTSASSFGYMLYGKFLVAHKADLDTVYQYGRLAIALQRRLGRPEITVKLNVLFSQFINHYVNPYYDNVRFYKEAYQISRQIGEVWWGNWSVLNEILARFEQGESLHKIVDKAANFKSYIHSSGNGPLILMFDWFVQQMTVLTQPLSVSSEQDNQTMMAVSPPMGQLTFDVGIIWYHVNSALQCFLFRELGLALQHTKLAEKVIGNVMGMSLQTNHQFYHGLILAACFDDASKKEQWEYRQSIDKCLTELRFYAKTGRCNYRSKYLLLKAESARITNDVATAMRCYDEAMATAQTFNSVHVQSIAAELAGRFYHQLSHPRFASLYINDAITCYNLWGAVAIAEQLASHFESYTSSSVVSVKVDTSKTLTLKPEQYDSPNTSRDVHVEQLDFIALLSTVRSFAKESDLSVLLTNMMGAIIEQSGAQKVSLIINQDNELHVEAQGYSNGRELEQTQVLQSLPLVNADLPREVVYMVGRTCEEVVLDDATNDERFANSNYIMVNQCQSLACLPIINRGCLVAIAYVENNSTAGAFTSQRMEILRFLASQAATSIENALLRCDQHDEEFEYLVGGSIDSDALCYMPRQADDSLYKAIKNKSFCYVLNPRQMGKSSLRVHTMNRLVNEGYRCASIDITSIGSQQVTIEQWYAGLARALVTGLDLHQKVNLRKWWREHSEISAVQRLSELIDSQVLSLIDSNIVVFIDEIDSVISLGFNPDDFFASIRAMFNKRVDDKRYERLSFVLLGVALPSELIQDNKRTPFNIGVDIRLKGFRTVEAMPLARGLKHKSDDAEILLREVIAWTGGQPFLTQKICRLLAQSPSKPAKGDEKQWVAQQVLDHVINNWEAQDHPEHLLTVRNRLMNSTSSPKLLLNTYRTILSEGESTYDGNPLHEELILSGLVVREWDSLSVANNIYSSVFNLHWIDMQLTMDNELKRQG